MDLRCYSIHFFYKIKDAELYGGIGNIGYAETNLDRAVNTEAFTAEHFAKASENIKIGIAEQLKVPVENITAIHRDEYEEATREDEEHCCDQCIHSDDEGEGFIYCTNAGSDYFGDCVESSCVKCDEFEQK